MKPFRFTLEAVSTVRKRAEHEALESFANALLLRGAALEHLDAVQRDLDAVWTEMRQEVARGCRAARMAQLRLHSQAVEEERARRETDLQQAERAVNQALQRMLAAHQQREVVDKFRSQQRARHELHLGRETQKFLDELATQRPLPALAWRTTADPFA